MVSNLEADISGDPKSGPAGDVLNVWITFEFDVKKLLRKVERATGIEPVLAAWEFYSPLFYFQDLQNDSAKMHVHVTHTVLRIAKSQA